MSLGPRTIPTQKGSPLFRRALKHAALAAALLLPTLAGVVIQAPAAHASGTASAYPTGSGQEPGEASLVETHSSSTCGTGAYTRYYTVSADPEALDGHSTRNGGIDYHSMPGKAVGFDLTWNTVGTDCPADDAYDTNVTLYHWNGSSFDNISTCEEVGTTNGTASGSDLGNELDNYCLDGFYNEWGIGGGGDSSGTPLAGQWYVGISLADSVGTSAPESGASTEGGLPAGSNVTSSYTKGMFSTGYMSGFGDARGYSAYNAIDSAVGKDMSLVRIFGGNWSKPGTVGDNGDIDKNAAAHRGIIWSINPTGSNFTVDGTDSRWKTVADGDMDSGTFGLTTILSQLDAFGAHYNVPILFAIRHEPHAKASDWASCGTSCEGTSTEYKNMYAHLRSLMGAGDVNYPHVKLIYIAVDTNMNANKIHNTSTSCGDSGCGDSLRPADTDYDVLGPDLYNYFKWVSGCSDPLGGTTCTSTSGAWLMPTSDGTGSSRVNTTAKIGLTTTKGDIVVAKDHNKHIIFPELGTHPGCPGSGTDDTSGNVGHCATGDPSYQKDAWFRDLATGLTSNADYEKWIEGWAYFNNNHSTSSGTIYDWQFVDRSGNSNNSESACPSGVPCWTGLTGYQDLVVNSDTYNNSHPDWVVGSSAAAATFQP